MPVSNMQVTTSDAGSQIFFATTLTNLLNSTSAAVKARLDTIKTQGTAMSISDMFDLQLEMNYLAQMSEMSTTLVSASNTAITSIARNIK
jgi:hypothetical protein